MKIQIAIIGPPGVGKSSLLRRLKEDKFNDHHFEPTMGANRHYLSLILSNQQYNVVILDCQGLSNQCRLRAIPLAMKCQGFLVVMNISEKDSFKLAKQCYEELLDECNPQTQVMTVIGNKNDLKENRKVDYNQVNQYWSARGVQYTETSAKTSKVIRGVFERVARGVIVDLRSKQRPKKLGMVLEEQSICQQNFQKKEKKGCSC